MESMTDDMFEENTMKFKNNLFSSVWQILCFKIILNQREHKFSVCNPKYLKVCLNLRII